MTQEVSPKCLVYYVSKKVHINIEITEINSPSDFKLYSLNENFERVSDRHTIDISDSNEKSAYINGTLRFVSSLEFIYMITIT